MTKADNLKILQRHGINVPNFIVIDDESSYAVRSSADCEDSVNRSHAGQFDSFLYVKKGEIEEKIKLVENSAKKSNEKNIKISVIVQEMIRPDYSGVMFTANPINGKPETIIEAVKGDAKDLLAGKVSPDFELPPKIKNELVSIGKKIEKIFGCPQDVEFCVKDGIISIVQSRPITSVKK